jgi:hypothetical protein
MLFITEEIRDINMQTITEEVDGKKYMFIEGVFLQDSIKNRNGRIYPKQVMHEAVSKYKMEYINTKRSISELNHPTSPQVNPERASHMVTSLNEDGNNWIGKAKLLNTPMGNLVKNLIEDGVQMGVSSRGLGSVKESNGANVVQNGYNITAIDVVSDPSAPDAFVNGIMENKEWIFDNGILVEREIESIKKQVNESVRKNNFNDDVLKSIFHKIVTKF